MEEKKLTENELINFLEQNGIVHEINRTFLHPLSLDLRVNHDTKEIEIWQTDDTRGYLLDRINPMHKQVFQKLSMRRHSERQSKLGFGIQTHDVYRKDNLRKIAALLIAPERMKIELIMTCLSAFSHLIYSKFIQYHKQKDSHLEPEQFDKEQLIRLLNVNLKENDWVDVASYAMLLHQHKELQTGMEDINVKAVDYLDKQKQRQTHIVEKQRVVFPEPIKEN